MTGFTQLGMLGLLMLIAALEIKAHGGVAEYLFGLFFIIMAICGLPKYKE